jgi:hypothetical protein
MLSFTILYSLAIYYKRQLPYHMRYMICTGLLIFVPGLGRLLTISLGFSGMSTGIIILIITFGSYLGLIVFDKLKRNPVSPYWVGLALVALTNFTVATNKTGWWQWTAGKVASLIF